MDTIQFLGTIGFGAILWVVVQHYLQRSTIAAERVYSYRKEELLRYRKMAEKVIEKLMLLENHREILLKYLQLSSMAASQENTIFLDLNNTFNKENFEANQEQIATIIYLYFGSLKNEWNDCLNKMSEIFNVVLSLDLQIKAWGNIDWSEIVSRFNLLNSEFGDIPWNLSEKIKNDIILKEKDVINQKSKIFLS